MYQVSTLAAYVPMLLEVVFSLSALVLKKKTKQFFSIVSKRHNDCSKNT